MRLFRVRYDNSVSCVRTGGTHSSWFKIDAGVRHGCVLAPDSFATGMDWLLDRTVESCSHLLLLLMYVVCICSSVVLCVNLI